MRGRLGVCLLELPPGRIDIVIYHVKSELQATQPRDPELPACAKDPSLGII
jgi:hypothetical protein